MNSSIQRNAGDQVYGIEGNLFIETLNGFNGSAELLGFYGNTDIQGGAGADYSLSNSFFLDVKAMFSYSEIGIRIKNRPEIYGGVKTLENFDPAQNKRTVDSACILVPASY